MFNYRLIKLTQEAILHIYGPFLGKTKPNLWYLIEFQKEKHKKQRKYINQPPLHC